MATEYKLKMVVQAIDRATGPLRKVGQAMGEMSRRARLDVLADKLRAARERVAALGRMAHQARDSLMRMGAGALAKITAPLGLLSGFAIKTAADMEQLEVSFQSMLGGADAAKAMVKSLSDFAASTPFQLEGIGGAARQLLSFGVAQEDVMGNLKVLGDIAAGANVPLQDMAAIFGKTKAKGKAMTEELLQLSDRGIPIIDVLAKQMNLPKQAIFALASQGRISFDILSKAMESMTRDGGMFADQMKRQSATLAGRFSTLKDNIIIALGEIGVMLDETFNLRENITRLTGLIQGMTQRFKAFTKEHPGLAKLVFILAAVAAAAGPVLIGLGLLASGVGFLAAGLSVLMGPLGLVVLALAAVAAGAAAIYANWSDIAAFFEGIWNDVKAAFDEGFVNGIANVLAAFNPVTLIAKGINALIDYLFGIDLSQAGAAMIASLGNGISAAFGDMANWLSEQAGPLAKLFGVEDTAPKGKPGQLAPAVRPAIQGGQGTQRMEGGIDIRFHDAPTSMRVERIRPDANVGIDVDAGYAMAGP